MSKTKKIIIGVIIGVLVLGGLIIAAYFGLQYKKKVYNTLILQIQRTNSIEDFLVKTFPEEVKKYNDAAELPPTLPEKNRRSVK